jgi:MATE family multidrug resistance protein
VIGFPAAWALAFRADLGAVGVWIGLSIGTTVHAGLLILRFWQLSKRFESS